MPGYAPNGGTELACNCKKSKAEISKAREEQRARRAAYREAQAAKKKETVKSG